MGISYMDCLTKAQQSSRFHPSTKAFWMIVITLGEVFLEYFPSLRATGTKVCCSLWHSVSKRSSSGASIQHKRQHSALYKSPGQSLAHGKANQSHGTSCHLHIFTCRWLL